MTITDVRNVSVANDTATASITADDVGTDTRLWLFRQVNGTWKVEELDYRP
jgi:hypothetical protein